MLYSVLPIEIGGSSNTGFKYWEGNPMNRRLAVNTPKNDDEITPFAAYSWMLVILLAIFACLIVLKKSGMIWFLQ